MGQSQARWRTNGQDSYSSDVAGGGLQIPIQTNQAGRGFLDPRALGGGFGRVPLNRPLSHCLITDVLTSIGGAIRRQSPRFTESRDREMDDTGEAQQICCGALSSARKCSYNDFDNKSSCLEDKHLFFEVDTVLVLGRNHSCHTQDARREIEVRIVEVGRNLLCFLEDIFRNSPPSASVHGTAN